MSISKHLTLKEVIKSNTAIRLGIDNAPSMKHLHNLKILAENVFEPVRTHFNVPVYVSSCYRSLVLNRAINGARGSQHLLGMAIDIDQDFRSTVSNLEIFNYIKDNLDFDQLIWEYTNEDGTPAWIHCSYNKGKNRNQILKAIKIGKKTKYLKYET